MFFPHSRFDDVQMYHTIRFAYINRITNRLTDSYKSLNADATQLWFKIWKWHRISRRMKTPNNNKKNTSNENYPKITTDNNDGVSLSSYINYYLNLSWAGQNKTRTKNKENRNSNMCMAWQFVKCFSLIVSVLSATFCRTKLTNTINSLSLYVLRI